MLSDAAPIVRDHRRFRLGWPARSLRNQLPSNATRFAVRKPQLSKLVPQRRRLFSQAHSPSTPYIRLMPAGAYGVTFHLLYCCSALCALRLDLYINMSQHRPPWDTYSQELRSLGHGLPLWRPEPDTRYGAVSLGDVGYVREGHFRFLFNCMLPADHSQNSIRGVPPGFTMFSPPSGSNNSMPNVIGPKAHLHSRSVFMRTATASGAGQYVGLSSIG